MRSTATLEGDEWVLHGTKAFVTNLGESLHEEVRGTGVHVTTLRGTYEELADAFQRLVDSYVDAKYPKRAGVTA